jgi:hypothetical protein
MSAVKKVVNIMRNNISTTIQLPIPSPVEIVHKPSIEGLIQIPPPYCPVCNIFLTNLFCNIIIKPKSCPLNGEYDV